MSIYNFFFLIQVALVYQADDPINFITSFYGCLIAGIIPVPIEPPASKDVSLKILLVFTQSNVVLIKILASPSWCLFKSGIYSSDIEF